MTQDRDALYGEEPLLKAVVDVERVGERWPDAIVMLIEKHEMAFRFLATRRVARRLMERYAAEYFPAAELNTPVRQRVNAVLRARYFDRMSLWIRRTVSPCGIVSRPTRRP